MSAALSAELLELDALARLAGAPLERRLLCEVAVGALRQLCAAARFRPGVQAPPVPLLVLASLRDPLFDVRCSIGPAQRWHAAIALHSDAGHDLPLDDSAWVAEQVARWLGPGGSRIDR